MYCQAVMFKSDGLRLDQATASVLILMIFVGLHNEVVEDWRGNTVSTWMG
jgi:hypothetical protein